MLWKDSDMDGSEAALPKRKPVPANPPLSGISDAPGWKPGPYTFEHVDYFANIPGLQGGTFEISDEGRTDNWLGQTLTIEQAQLFSAAPDLYAALDDLTDITVCIDGPIGADPQFFSDLRDRTRRALAIMEKARGSVPESQPTTPEPGTGSQEAD